MHTRLEYSITQNNPPNAVCLAAFLFIMADKKSNSGGGFFFI